jgi:hypothetical protein
VINTRDNERKNDESIPPTSQKVTPNWSVSHEKNHLRFDRGCRPRWCKYGLRSPALLCSSRSLPPGVPAGRGRDLPPGMSPSRGRNVPPGVRSPMRDPSRLHPPLSALPLIGAKMFDATFTIACESRCQRESPGDRRRGFFSSKIRSGRSGYFLLPDSVSSITVNIPNVLLSRSRRRR